MPWTESLLDELAARREWSYHTGGPISTEPAALTALALLSHGRAADARPALEWLAKLQSESGAVGVTASLAEPTWATSLAVIAWSQYQSRIIQSPTADGPPLEHYSNAIETGRDHLLSQFGQALPRNKDIGHDTTLVGWSWATATHSWIEPTSLNVLALKSLQMSDHTRTRQAVRLLLDRQLPGGGANYGNTFVLGQKLIPHHQPTALSLLALVGETEKTIELKKISADETTDAAEVDSVLSDSAMLERREMSIAYLAREWPRIVGTASTCYAAMALEAYDRAPTDLQPRLAELFEHRRDTTGAYPLALIALAAAGRNSVLGTTGTSGTLGTSGAPGTSGTLGTSGTETAA